MHAKRVTRAMGILIGVVALAALPPQATVVSEDCGTCDYGCRVFSVMCRNPAGLGVHGWEYDEAIAHLGICSGSIEGPGAQGSKDWVESTLWDDCCPHCTLEGGVRSTGETVPYSNVVGTSGGWYYRACAAS